MVHSKIQSSYLIATIFIIAVSLCLTTGCAKKSRLITEQVAPNVYRITVSRSNIYLITGKTLILVDTGMPGDGPEVLKAIAAIGRNPAEASHILITHGHTDHIGSLAFLKKATGAQVIAGTPEVDYIQGKKKPWQMAREGFSGKLFKIMLFFAETFIFTREPAVVDQACSGGEVIDCNGGITVIATPGHSPGSISYYLPDKRILFTGDALSGEPEAKLPPRAGCADYPQARLSVKKLTALSFDICCFGHGTPVTRGAAALAKKLLSPSP
jgi:glyoxylase-like metal-dependent hydrolase (beta-lactamase superfamily II)